MITGPWVSTGMSYIFLITTSLLACMMASNTGSQSVITEPVVPSGDLLQVPPPKKKKEKEKKAVSQTHLRRHKDSEVRNSLYGFVHELALQVTVIHRFESHLSLFPLAAIKIDHKFSE